MAAVPIVLPETSPLAVRFYEFTASGDISPPSLMCSLTAGGLVVPASAANPIPTTPATGAITTVVGIITNPTSTLTRPANTTAYAQNDLIASNVTAGSIVVPSITLARAAAGNFMLRRLRLTTPVTTGWDAATLLIRLWTAAPTYTNGDNGAYAVATGAAGYVGQFSITLAQFGDGASGVGAPAVGSEIGMALASGTVLYWDVQITSSAALTPTSAQTFVLTAEDYQN